MTGAGPCVQCRGADGDAELRRVQVWEDDLWRVTTVLSGQVPGFSFLEPKRHIPHIEHLDGREAQAFGVVLAGVTRALKDATGAERVYVHVFGSGSPHLHVHLEPHLAGGLSANLVSDEKTGGAGGEEADRQYVAELIRHHLVDMGAPASA